MAWGINASCRYRLSSRYTGTEACRWRPSGQGQRRNNRPISGLKWATEYSGANPCMMACISHLVGFGGEWRVGLQRQRCTLAFTRPMAATITSRTKLKRRLPDEQQPDSTNPCRWGSGDRAVPWAEASAASVDVCGGAYRAHNQGSRAATTTARKRGNQTYNLIVKRI